MYKRQERERGTYVATAALLTRLCLLRIKVSNNNIVAERILAVTPTTLTDYETPSRVSLLGPTGSHTAFSTNEISVTHI